MLIEENVIKENVGWSIVDRMSDIAFFLQVPIRFRMLRTLQRTQTCVLERTQKKKLYFVLKVVKIITAVITWQYKYYQEKTKTFLNEHYTATILLWQFRNHVTETCTIFTHFYINIITKFIWKRISACRLFVNCHL